MNLIGNTPVSLLIIGQRDDLIVIRTSYVVLGKMIARKVLDGCRGNAESLLVLGKAL
jgi:hypothetical protein